MPAICNALGVLNPQTVTRLIDAHLHGQCHHQDVLWVCLASFVSRIGDKLMSWRRAGAAC